MSSPENFHLRMQPAESEQKPKENTPVVAPETASGENEVPLKDRNDDNAVGE